MLLKQNFLLAFFKNFKQDGAGNLRERKATQKTNEKKKGLLRERSKTMHVLRVDGWVLQYLLACTGRVCS